MTRLSRQSDRVRLSACPVQPRDSFFLIDIEGQVLWGRKDPPRGSERLLDREEA